MRVVLILLIGLLTATKAQACQCIPLTFDEEVKNSNSIFHGRVVSADNYKFEIEIIQRWKGDFKLKVLQLTHGRTSCERRTFELNKEYLFYLRDNSIFNCSRTEEFNLTTDTELLDLTFNRVGDSAMIDSKTLTDRQLTVLKNILSKKQVPYPTNIGHVKILYAQENEFIEKRTFFESSKWSGPKIKLLKINDDQKINDTETYILWTGHNWDKSFKKLKRSM